VIIPQGLKTSPVSTTQCHSTLKIQNPTGASELGPQFSPSSSPQLSPSLSQQESWSDDDSDHDREEITSGMEDVKLSSVSIHNGNYINAPLYHNVTRKLIFCIQFMDGYTFRQLYEFYKMTLTTAPMFLSPQGITILRGNGDASLVVNT
jgi:hypothetical protein